MSEYIPSEIQSEIMKMLPVKSLLRFRSGCKSWKSLINGSDFIAHYRSQQQSLLVTYYTSHQTYVSIVDDHTFPQHKVSLTVPEMVNTMLKYPRIIGTSLGLVCFYCRATSKAVIWNIAIRKTVVVVVPTAENNVFQTALGFGVCRRTSDPKIVKVTYVDQYQSSDLENITSHVEVFTLSTGAWRSPYGSNLPRNSIYLFHYEEVVIDGVFYWLAFNRISVDGGFNYYRLIISFDMTSEEFREITLPHALSCNNNYISMSYLWNSLVVCGYVKDVTDTELCVWMMGDGVSKPFTKLYTITLNEDAMVRGFRKSGEPIIHIKEEGICGCGQLAVYDLYSKRVDYLGIEGVKFSFKVYPYMETLFLLDQPSIMVE